MEKSNQDPKQASNAHDLNEGFSGKNTAGIYTSSEVHELKKEEEADATGTVSEVARARQIPDEAENAATTSPLDYPNESSSQTQAETQCKDFNSNPNPKQFPDKIKQNKENRGNIVD